MAYNKTKIFKQAQEVTVKNKLFFIEDVVALLPCGKPTFYSFFPPESNELNTLKDLLEINRVNIKVSLRSKWYKSSAPALQLALYKLSCTPEELKKLSMQHVESENTNVNKNFDISKIYDDDEDEDTET